MSAAEQVLKEKIKENSKPKTAPFLNRFLDFVSSVRFGVVLLCVLVVLAMVGMLVIQQNVNGFDAYYASLTPAEKTVYGFLGIFDIYHSSYFLLSLLVLSLNIVLASIDHFPSSWSYIRAPKLSATRGFLLRQKQNTVLQIEGENEKEIAERISRVFKENGLKSQITESKSSFYLEDENGNKNYSKMESKTNLSVFGESGRFNRLGAYVVHVALLTLFLGHFVALQSGFDADVRMMPGQATSDIQMIEFNLDKQERYNVALPFTINCTDIQQNLIDPKGSIEINNTLDWHTRIEIDDPEYGKTLADVSLNKPFSYRGYRFFQASAITVGSARNMTLEVTPQTGGEPVKINLPRNGSANLPDGTKIDYEAFFPDFILQGSKPDTRSAEYNNPAVKLNIMTPDGERKSAYAFGKKMPDNIPIGAPVAGYKWHLGEFEKSPLAHVLSIKYDPYNAAFVAWYFGGFGLIGALAFVFFLAHRRVWALIEKTSAGNFEVVLGGDANRNAQGFEDKFGKIIRQLTTPNNQNIHQSEQ
ncbi:MAG: cytochrome c biogenesis protein ResB [Acidobacteriota bacterium]|nr:cytochrome c biogenesis protein ResB [Acidobacteriota bacterium]